MTATELLALWRQRDNLYDRKRNGVPRTLTEREFESIVDWRRAEVGDLPPRDRVKMLAALALWHPRTVE